MSKEIWMNEEEEIEEIKLNDMKKFVDHVEWVYLHTDQVFDSEEMVEHLAMLEEIKQFCNDMEKRAKEENRERLLEIANTVYKRVRNVQYMIEERYFNK